MVAPECAPAAKAGGLGDVVSGLSRELELRGNAVEIILPKYASLRYSEIWDLRPSYHDLPVPWYGGSVRCTVWFGYANGRGPGPARSTWTSTSTSGTSNPRRSPIAAG